MVNHSIDKAVLVILTYIIEHSLFHQGIDFFHIFFTLLKLSKNFIFFTFLLNSTYLTTFDFQITYYIKKDKCTKVMA